MPASICWQQEFVPALLTSGLQNVGLFYDLDPTVYTGSLANVHGKYERSTQAWNAHEWELTP